MLMVQTRGINGQNNAKINRTITKDEWYRKEPESQNHRQIELILLITRGLIYVL